MVLGALMTLLLPAAAGMAATINVPADAPTIQAGIDMAIAGDIVEVACDVYYEHDIMMKSGVTLRSATGIADCARIHAERNGRVIICDNVTDCVIEGFSIVGGLADYGAGIYCNDASITVRSCIIRNNNANEMGGGMACMGNSMPLIQHCTFVYNRTVTSGSALYAAGSSDVQLETSIITYGRDGVPFTGAVFCADSGAVHCMSCDIWGNEDGDWVGCIDMQGTMNGNFQADACFCAPALNDFTISSGSWCLDVNHPWGWNVTVGAMGAGCDIGSCGPVAAEAQTWGSVKELYR
jgi:hypothetical protein